MRAPDRQDTTKETTMHNESSRNPGEPGHGPPGQGLRVRPLAAQAAGPDAAPNTGVATKPPEGRGPAGLTERLAAARLDALAAEVRK
jgi:hypothetical protein